MVEIALFLFEKVLTILPEWIARRLFSPSRVADEIEIDLLRTNPIAIYFKSTEFPCVEIWFRISNLSPVSVVLDRLLIDLWVNQPTLKGSFLRRVEIPRRSSTEVIHFWHDLTKAQEERIVRHADQNGVLTVPVSIEVEAYFESRVGMVYVERRLEHRDLRLG